MNLKKSVYNGTKRIFYLDALRVMAIACVIMIHVYTRMRGFILTEYAFPPSFNWLMTLFFGNVPRIGVDLFLILSGALSLGRVWDIKSFLGKRIPRIISPFVFWSVCIVLSVMIVSVTIPGVFKLPEQGFTISGFLNLFYAYIMAAKPYAHQNWFFWMILGTYLIMPIFNKWILHADFSEIEYFLVFWLVTCFFDYTLMTACPIKLSYFTSPIGLVVLGYYLRHTERKLLNNAYFGIGLIIISIILTMILGYYLSDVHEIYTFNRYSILNSITVIGVFVLFKTYDQLRIYKFLTKFKDSFISVVYHNSVFSIAKYSYGIYLIHLVILHVLIPIVVGFANSYKVSFMLCFVLCLGISWAIMAILNRVPKVNNVIGAK